MFLWIKKLLRLFPPFSTYVLIRKFDRMRPSIDRIIEDFGKLDEMIRSLKHHNSLLADAYLTLGRTIARNSPQEAIDCFHRALSFDSTVPYAHRYLAEAYIHIGDMPRALDYICQALRIPKITAMAQTPMNDAGDPVDRRRLMMTHDQRSSVTIGTSLMPRRIAEQKAAVRSWKRLGLEVVSVNSASEIAVLFPQFPEVTFREATRTAEAQCGKPVVPIDEMIRVLGESESPIVGIVNSDIIIEETDGFLDTIRRQVSGGLVLSNRFDVDNAGSADGRLYAGGYDLFFFERAESEIFASSGMIMGMPWWDFWMPLAAHLGGLKLKKLTSTRVLHFTHPIGYSFELFIGLSAPFVDSLAAIARKYPLVSNSQLATLTRCLFGSIDAHVRTSGHPLAPHEAGALCGFANFLIDYMSTELSIMRSTMQVPPAVVVTTDALESKSRS